MKKFITALTIAAAATLSVPALAADYLGKSDIDFFYFEVEGGYAVFDGADDTGGGFTLSPDGGAYGTFTLGHVSIDDGIIGGFVDRAELWVTYADQGDDANSGYTTERNYWEIGTRFQHYFDQNAHDKTMWGFEPFVGFVDGDFASPMALTIGYDATIYGAMLSFEHERHIAPMTIAHFRAAVGLYGGSSDANSSGAAVPDDDFGGFRGQLAAGITQKISERASIGAVARLDYFSDMPKLDAPTVLTTDDQLGVYLGVNVNVIIGGTYR
ncbi:hypothetical protein ACKTEK_03055 [Tepidamorphus sp. 3E244]|uniref:hypothetical protein n=1 Tax=Tepidamorphus sp. 3E244 TaxID=3385498 RepID=UPI0038FCACA2